MIATALMLGIGVASARPERLVLKDGSALQSTIAGYVGKEKIEGLKASGSRFALNLGDDRGWLVSPLVWEAPKNKCDGDEPAVGNPSTNFVGKVPRWCPPGGSEDADPVVPTLELRHEGAFDLAAENGTLSWNSEQLNTLLAKDLEGVYSVWAHGHFQGANETSSHRRPCVPDATNVAEQFSKRDENQLIGLSTDANVLVGWMRLYAESERWCRIKRAGSSYSFDSTCNHPGSPGEQRAGEIMLFDMGRGSADRCIKGDPYAPWAVRIDVHGEAAPAPSGGAKDQVRENGVKGGQKVDWGKVVTEYWLATPIWEKLAIGAVISLLGVAVVGVVAVLGAIVLGYKFGKPVLSWIASKLRVAWNRLRQRLGGGAEVALLDTDLARALYGEIRRAWPCLDESQIRKLEELARGNSSYIRSTLQRPPTIQPVEPQLGRLGQKWQARWLNLRSRPPSKWGPEDHLVAATSIVLTLAERVEFRRQSTIQSSEEPAALSVFRSFFDRIARIEQRSLQEELDRGGPPKNHPISSLARRVLDIVRLLELPRESQHADSGAKDRSAQSAPGDALRVDILEPGGHEVPIKPVELAHEAVPANVLKPLHDRVRALEATQARLLNEQGQMVADMSAQKAQIDSLRLSKQEIQEQLERANRERTALVAELHVARSKLKTLEEEKLRQAEAEQRVRDAEKDKFRRADVAHIAACFEQVLTYGALRRSLKELAQQFGEVGRISEQIHALLSTSKELLRQAESGPLRGATGYLVAWRTLEEDLTAGHDAVASFMAGVGALLDTPDARGAVNRLLQHPAYAPVGDHESESSWSLGYRAWRDLYSLADRRAGDDGISLSEYVVKRVFERLLVPWLRLAQFIAEALPHESPDVHLQSMATMRTSSDDVAETAGRWFGKLGYRYEHVPLYVANRSAYITRRRVQADRVETSLVLHELPLPDRTKPGTVLRVSSPLIVKGPDTHAVLAKFLCTDDEES